MRALVTGGGGFLGLAIVRELCARGDTVTTLARREHPALAELGVRSVRGDITQPATLRPAFEGVDTVFHVAAKAGVWGARADYVRTNVDGTRHVLDAALEAGVQRFVFTSSPSVCFDGADHVRAGNDLAHARRFLCDYPETKARAERLVLAANGERGLATCALRPHLIFGPDDPHLLPRLLARARAGRLALIGSGTNEVSLTYIDNAAHAHVVAADRLSLGAAHAGRAYFIAQQEPVILWDWVRELLTRLHIAPPRRRVPFALAYGAGATLELVWHALRRSSEPPLTRFVALQLARSHSYDLRPAQRDLGYEERISMRDATERTLASLAQAGA